MKLLAQNAKGHYREIILGPIFKLFEAILELLVPLVMADIIDVGVATGDTAYIIRRAIVLVVLALLGVVFAMICQYYAAVAAGAFGLNLRRQIYMHILRLSPAETSQFGAGGLTTRLTNDANNIQTGLNMAIRLGTRIPFLAAGSIVMAMSLNFKIGLIFLISTPLVAGVLFLIMRYTVPGYERVQGKQDNLSRLSAENLSGMRVIRAFSRQKQEQKEYDAAANGLSAWMIRVGKISAAINPLTNIIVSAAIAAIVWLGAGFAERGDVLPGEVMALVTYMNQTLLALLVAAHLTVVFTRTLASGKRVNELLNVDPTIQDGPGAAPVAGAPAVAFDRVSFTFPDGAEHALEDISFSAHKGSIIGVIGGTGSGKTALINLIVRYYDATDGRVLINGANVRGYTLHDLRGLIGLVPQTASLLSGSVRHNMQVGKPGATDEEIWRALDTAQASEFVRRMQNGLDAHIEEKGRNLSGGQKQRLTIARALVREPEILILDDASSALDYATDARLRQALSAAESGRTVFLISQRAASIKDAGMILVLDDGRLVGQGSHKELLASNAVYREICASQGISGEVGA